MPDQNEFHGVDIHSGTVFYKDAKSVFMNKIRTLAVLNLLSLLGQIVFSYLTQNKLVNQLDVGEISARHESLMTPAGITFLIWGIIYTALGILCLYHLYISFKHDRLHEANQDILGMDGLFIFTNLAAIAWMLAWTHEQILASVLLILIQLVTLVAIHSRLRIHDPLRSRASKGFTQIPLSIYLGWITIATIANTSSYLAGADFNKYGLTDMQWSIIMISVAVFFSVLMIVARRNVFFGLVVIWGLYGIILKRQSVDASFYKPLIITAWAGMGLILLCCIIRIFNDAKISKPQETFPNAAGSIK